MRTSAGAMRHEAQEGPIVATVRVKAQHCTSPHRSPWRWHARAIVCDEQPDRPGIRGGRSPQRQQQKPSPTTCAVTREGEWCGYMGRWLGWAGERGSSALTTGAVGAAAAVVICCTICSSCTRLAGCAPRSHLFSDFQLERDKLSRNGLHSGLANRKLSATMKPDLDGRTARGLQSRHKALSETYREKFSDLAKLQLHQAK